jgi:hypothetical protein
LDATPSIAATGALEISSNSSITATTGSAIVIDATGTSAASSIRLNSGSGVTRFGTSGLETFRIEQGTAYGGPIKLYATHHVTGALEEQIRLTNYGVNVIEGLRVGDTTQPTDNDIYAVADIEAGNDLTAGNDVAAGNDVVVSNDIRMTAGASDWKFEVGASNEVLISYGGTNMFKLDSSGNLTVRGNVTAFDTSI